MTPDAFAKERGWLILVPGEAYERSLRQHRALYLYALDDGRWEAAYYTRGEYGERLRVLIQTPDWRRAFEEAARFEDWLKTKARGGKSSGSERDGHQKTRARVAESRKSG